MIDGKFKSEEYALLGGINSKASPYLNGPHELRSIINMNFVTPGSLTKRPGSTGYLGATVAGNITGGVEFQRLNGASYVVVTANTNAYTVTSSFNAFKTGLLNGARFDFVTFVDRLFACNGTDFFKFDGSNNAPYSLPPGATGFGVTAVVGGSLTSGITGTFVCSYGYLNDRGYFGPSSPGVTIVINGATFNSIQYVGMTAPSNFGISNIACYRSSATSADQFGTTLSDLVGASFIDIGFPLVTRPANYNLYFTLAPRYMEIYNNQLFMAGFSNALSTVFWSDIGEPEGIDPDSFDEFRTNDGDRITGLKSYSGSLIVTKERSIHRLVGDDPTNLATQEISDQYGCISNQAMVVYENILLFLDSKGVARFDGANTKIISNKLEAVFKSMNIDAARDNALSMHVREYNEVWFAIPTDGSTYNNTIVVYDYLTDCGTVYKGLNASALFLARGNLDRKYPFIGGYSGTVAWVGSSFMGDSGAAVTCAIQSHFLAVRGETTENMYRRFYLNLNPILGVTQPITVNFKTNYDGTTTIASRTMYQNPYQSRVDFGISSRSVQAEIIHASATLPLVVSGYTFESREQRSV